MSWLTPGHYTDPLARDLHFVIPMCPSWIVATISWRNDLGITIRSPYVSIPSVSESMFLTELYSLKHSFTS